MRPGSAEPFALMGRIYRGVRPGASSDGFLHLAALEAAGADVGALGDAVDQHADALEVGIEAALRRNHGVAPVVPEARGLTARDADLRHGARIVQASARAAAANRS